MSFVANNYYTSWTLNDFFIFIGFINQFNSVINKYGVENRFAGYTFSKQDHGAKLMKHYVYLQVSRKCTNYQFFFRRS